MEECPKQIHKGIKDVVSLECLLNRKRLVRLERREQ